LREKIQQKIFPALGTVNSITIYGDHDPQILDECKKLILRMDRELSIFRPDSLVSEISRNAGLHPVPVTWITYSMIEEAKYYAGISGGAFDITAGPMSRLWKNAAVSGSMPGAQELRRARRLTGWQDMIVRPEEDPDAILSGGSLPSSDDERILAQVMLRRKGQSIDMGGIAKGWAADQVMRILKERGIDRAVINLGGTVISAGRSKKIGIQDPFRATGCQMGELELKDEAAVTSGSYEQSFSIDGRKFHHIIDPRTGISSDSGLMSVTLIAPAAYHKDRSLADPGSDIRRGLGIDAAGLDALATAVFVTGARQGLPLLTKLGVEAIFVADDGRIMATPAVSQRFKMNEAPVSGRLQTA